MPNHRTRPGRVAALFLVTVTAVAVDLARHIVTHESAVPEDYQRTPLWLWTRRILRLARVTNWLNKHRQ